MISQSGGSAKDVMIVVNAGDLKDHIVKTVGEQNVDLVVMGSHGRGRIGRLLLGSTSERVSHESHR